ncbi:MAG: winged helix-turn-helix domain-containing protein [Candidatus Bathyarchaeota archaeon]|nr:winged helix-turn-helix domain-containing protein [Candidatus Bathyarchaeota archaeon]
MEAQSNSHVKKINREAFKLLEDETRRQIVFMLRDESLNVKEIAKRLDLTPQNIYHHVNKLQDAEIIELNYEQRSGHLVESFYSVPADTYVYSDDRITESSTRRYMDVLFGLQEIGLPIKPNLETAVLLGEIQEDYQDSLSDPLNRYEFCEECAYSGFFMKFGPMNPLLLNRIYWYANLMRMNDAEFDESIEKMRKIREFLREQATM